MTLKNDIYQNMRSTLLSHKKADLFIEINSPDKDSQYNIVSYKRSGVGKLKTESYTLQFIRLHEQKDYSCILFDGSIIQAYYELDNKLNCLSKGSLKYYPNPGLKLGDILDCLGEDELETVELTNIAMQYNSNFQYSSNFIMIDFDNDPNAFREVLHPCSHMHIGAYHEFRLALNRFPLFSEFVDFIMFFYYRDFWFKINCGIKDATMFNNTIFEAYLIKKNELISKNLIDNSFSRIESNHFHMVF